VGRSDDARWMRLSDEALARRVSEELAVLLPHFGTPYETLVRAGPMVYPSITWVTISSSMKREPRARNSRSQSLVTPTTA